MNRLLIIANIRKTQGGITTQVHELAESLISEGIEVNIVSTHGSITERIKGILLILKKVKNCDTILGVGCAYTGFFPVIIASVISAIYKKKVIYNFHDGQVKNFIRSYYGFLKIILGNDKIVVATKFLCDSFRHYGFDSVIINNHFNKNDYNYSYKKSSEKIMIMWARSFERLYRVDLALLSAKLLAYKKNVEFHFYGTGSEYKYYTENFVSDNIHFHGVYNRNDLLNEYKKYDIFLNTTDYDNFPMSIVEAGLNKLIVVTTNVGGIKYLYTDDEVVYFEPGNIDNLKNTLENVISHFSDYQCYSEKLFRKVSSFNWTNVRYQWLNILNYKLA